MFQEEPSSSSLPQIEQSILFHDIDQEMHQIHGDRNVPIPNQSSFDEDLTSDFINEDITEHNRRRDRMINTSNLMQSMNPSQLFSPEFNDCGGSNQIMSMPLVTNNYPETFSQIPQMCEPDTGNVEFDNFQMRSFNQNEG